MSANLVEVVQWRTLAEIESSIASHLSAAQMAAIDLYEIKTRGLWQAEFKSFSEYALKRWDISRATANRWVHLGEAIAPLALGPASGVSRREPLPSQRQVEQARRKVSPINAKSRQTKPHYVGPRAVVVIGDAPGPSGVLADLLADIADLLPEPDQPETTGNDPSSCRAGLNALLDLLDDLETEAVAKIITEDELAAFDDWLEDIANLVEANGYGS